MSTAQIVTSDRVILFSTRRDDWDPLRSVLPQAEWVRSAGRCVEALHDRAATAVFGDVDLLAGSPWIAALLRSERLPIVAICDGADPLRSCVTGGLTRPLSGEDVHLAFQAATWHARPSEGVRLDLSFAMLLGEGDLSDGFAAMRGGLDLLAQSDHPCDAQALAVLLAAAHATRTPAITLGFRRLEEACRRLEERANETAAIPPLLRALQEEARLVLGPELQTS